MGKKAMHYDTNASMPSTVELGSANVTIYDLPDKSIYDEPLLMAVSYNVPFKGAEPHAAPTNVKRSVAGDINFEEQVRKVNTLGIHCRNQG